MTAAQEVTARLPRLPVYAEGTVKVYTYTSGRGVFVVIHVLSKFKEPFKSLADKRVRLLVVDVIERER